MTFILFMSFVIMLRIGELMLSRKNEIWLLQNGAVEYGKKHYPFIVALHVLFILSVFVEYLVRTDPGFNLLLMLFYFLLIAFKGWVIFSLGKFWNTKIYRIPNVTLIKKGPYRYLKHPNYLIVIFEIAVIPLIFNLHYTAVAFSLLNAIMLTIRIKEENRILQ
jgi:methyltransferase